MVDHEHHEADLLDLTAGDFWVQLESSPGEGPLWDRSLKLYHEWQRREWDDPHHPHLCLYRLP